MLRGVRRMGPEKPKKMKADSPLFVSVKLSNPLAVAVDIAHLQLYGTLAGTDGESKKGDKASGNDEVVVPAVVQGPVCGAFGNATSACVHLSGLRPHDQPLQRFHVDIHGLLTSDGSAPSQIVATVVRCRLRPRILTGWRQRRSTRRSTAAWCAATARS